MSSTDSPHPSPPPIGQRGIDTLCVMAVMTAIAVLVVALRMCVRLRSERGAGWDDWTIVIATVFAVAAFGVGIKLVQTGCGQHMTLVSPQYYLDFAFWATLNQLPGSISLTMTRISICLFLKRFFVTDSRWKWALNSMITLSLLALVSWFCFFFAQCRPIGKLFHKQAEGTCWSYVVISDIGYYQGAVWAFTDLVLAILPVVFLWKIRISSWTKFGICVLMGLGLFTAAFSIARIVLTGELDRITAAGQIPDVTWDLGSISIFVFLEMDTAIIAASLPSVMYLLRRLRHPKGRRSQIPEQNRVPTPQPKRSPQDPFRITGGSSRNDVESQTESGDSPEEHSSYSENDSVLPSNVVELKM